MAITSPGVGPSLSFSSKVSQEGEIARTITGQSDAVVDEVLAGLEPLRIVSGGRKLWHYNWRTDSFRGARLACHLSPIANTGSSGEGRY